ncbi:Transmembrane and ubiquitin-like domain-containing protein 2 [Trichoplax sp. H2]|nr:Transmembrane and ubiquitin-like domain-containing protein 2 [Trichoplax sp. H2]|eukprot:RDD45666.1 Transmembrane and ubiquitin-like domain-containing protein 2 [Trichoplax sp. H2]
MAVIEGIDDEVLLSIGTVALFCAAVILWAVKSSNNHRITLPIPQATMTGQNSQWNSDEVDPNQSTDDLIRIPANHSQRQQNTQSTDHPMQSNLHDQPSTPSTGDTYHTNLFNNRDTQTHPSQIHQTPNTSTTTPAASHSTQPDTLLRSRSNNNQTQQNDPNQTWTLTIVMLDQSRKVVSANPMTTVGELKEIAFPQDLAAGASVRLIYRGYELRDSIRTLAAYHITNHSNIHAVRGFRQGQQQSASQEQSQPQEESQELDLSKLFIPLLVLFIAFMWIVFFYNMEHFSGKAVIFLLAVTVVIMVTLAGTSGRVNVS